MRDIRVGKRRAQMVEDRLVGDFAGQPHITRRNPTGSGAHQRSPPMRRRTGNVADPARPGAGKELANRLQRARQHHRAAAQHRTQENLQAAIAAHVVERAPYRTVAERARGRHRPGRGAGQRRQRMTHQFGNTGRARGEQNPFSFVHRLAVRHAGSDRGARRHEYGRAQLGCGPVADHGIDLRRRHHARQMCRRYIGRAQHDAPRDTVEFDQRQCRRQLVARRQQHRPAAQLGEPPAERRAARQRGEADARVLVRQPALRQPPSGAQCLPERSLTERGGLRPRLKMRHVRRAG